jgi:hypothetical protein
MTVRVVNAFVSAVNGMVRGADTATSTSWFVAGRCSRCGRCA